MSTAREFVPYIHYCVGGNTKFWGSVLYRLRREDFQATEHADGVSPAWPIDYDTLAPCYENAERCTTCTAIRRRSDRAAALALPLRRDSTRAGDGGHRRPICAARAFTRRRCRWA